MKDTTKSWKLSSDSHPTVPTTPTNSAWAEITKHAKPETIVIKSSELTEAIEDAEKELAQSEAEFEPQSEKKKTLAETKKMIENFRDNLAKYPKHLSYEGSTVLFVLLSLKAEAQVYLNNLPSVDSVTLRTAFPSETDISFVWVKFDENKDFIITCPSSDPNAKNAPFTFFNTVAHPRPEDLKDMGAGEIQVEKDGDKIAVGGKILLDKKGIKRLIGTEGPRRESKTSEEDLPPRRQPVVGRNAYEIRADVLQMAVDWTTHSKEWRNEDDVVDVAKKFYAFVENKRY
jgi:hypothetical protein